MDTANTLIAIISTEVTIMLNIWTFYFIVILGALGFIGTLRSGSNEMDDTTKYVVSTFAIVFAAGNFFAMRETGTEILNLQTQLVAELAKDELPNLFAHIYSRWGEWLSLVGHILVLLLIWLPKSQKRQNSPP
jgi:hypothetical protein